LQLVKREEEEKGKKTIKETYRWVDKKIEKAYKKEEKVANRILWVVIAKADGTSVEEESLFRGNRCIMTNLAVSYTLYFLRLVGPPPRPLLDISTTN
jgi:hypothetical protein